jgi:hypothetical protein
MGKLIQFPVSRQARERMDAARAAFDAADDREAERAEARAARREPAAGRKVPAKEGYPEFDGLSAGHPEFATVEDFVESLCDDDRTEFNHRELQCLAHRTGKTVPSVREELEEFGLTLERRAVKREGRGFKVSSHDRWFGPGSSPTHGGGGGGAIIGMADPG